MATQCLYKPGWRSLHGVFSRSSDVSKPALSHGGVVVARSTSVGPVSTIVQPGHEAGEFLAGEVAKQPVAAGAGRGAKSRSFPNCDAGRIVA